MKERVSVPLVLDPARLTKLVADMSNPDMIEKINASPALIAAYEAMAKVLLGDGAVKETAGKVVEGPSPAKKAA
jgi:hypothetical protein